MPERAVIVLTGAARPLALWQARYYEADDLGAVAPPFALHRRVVPALAVAAGTWAVPDARHALERRDRRGACRKPGRPLHCEEPGAMRQTVPASIRRPGPGRTPALPNRGTSSARASVNDST